MKPTEATLKQEWIVSVTKSERVVSNHPDGHQTLSYKALPNERHKVELVIDVQGIAARLGNRASHNKNKVAKFLDGMVCVRDLGLAEGK